MRTLQISRLRLQVQVRCNDSQPARGGLNKYSNILKLYDLTRDHCRSMGKRSKRASGARGPECVPASRALKRRERATSVSPSFHSSLYSLLAPLLACLCTALLSRRLRVWQRLFPGSEVVAQRPAWPSEVRAALPPCRYDLASSSPPPPGMFPRVTSAGFRRARNSSRFCFPVIVTDALDAWPARWKWNKTYFGGSPTFG